MWSNRLTQEVTLMATLAELRRRRASGQKVADDPASFSIDEAFTGPPPRPHRRNRQRRLPTGRVINMPSVGSFSEMRAQRNRLKSELAAAEWEWERRPSAAGAHTMRSIRLVISELELMMVAEQDPELVEYVEREEATSEEFRRLTEP